MLLMSGKRLLLLSSSIVQGAGYLEYCASEIKNFLGTDVKQVLFIPFAGVIKTFDEYAGVVRERFDAMGYKLDSVHQSANASEMPSGAEAIVIGRCNPFNLLRRHYETGLTDS